MAPSSPRPPAENATLTLQVHDDDREELSTAARKYHRHPSRRDLCCVRFGRTRVLYSLSAQYGYFPMTAHVGPHWPFMLITYAVALGPLVMLVVSGDRIHVGLRIALITSSVVTTVVFSLVACSDPGVVFQSYEPLAPANGDELPTGEQPQRRHLRAMPAAPSEGRVPLRRLRRLRAQAGPPLSMDRQVHRTPNAHAVLSVSLGDHDPPRDLWRRRHGHIPAALNRQQAKVLHKSRDDQRQRVWGVKSRWFICSSNVV
ncbi:hypothetical protein PINS_up013595 [Pythium insidiosum]|nr:hypothetical protein PINS_up013595 [Pythium insidiosum]